MEQPEFHVTYFQSSQDLVVIVDNLDRVDMRPLTASRRSPPEYLFIDRGEQFQKLNCHVVYTIPLALIFSNDYETLKNCLRGGLATEVLPIMQVQLQDSPEGIPLL